MGYKLDQITHSNPALSTAIGNYFDGHSAAFSQVTLTLTPAGIIDLQPPLQPPTHLTKLIISSRIGTSPRSLRFSDGAVIETNDHAAIDQWQKAVTGNSRQQWIHRLESRVAYGAGALIFIICLIGISLIWGIPWSSNLIAHALPGDITETIGDASVESMDQVIFKPSALSQVQRQRLEQQFQQLLFEQSANKGYQLEFRQGGIIGPNAFAFPNGVIIITDEMVALAEQEAELLAILLHEIGHLQQRHSLRQIISHSSLAMLTTLLTGDITAAGSLVVAAPNILMKAGYSRDMETEADTYALHQMQRLQLETDHFANIMERLESVTGVDHDQQNGDEKPQPEAPPTSADPDKITTSEAKLDAELPTWLDFFASHPLTQERVARFRQH